MSHFDFNDNYVLEDDRVILKPLTANDYEHLLPFALNEPDTWKFSLATAAGKEGLHNYMNIALKARAENKEYAFVVFDKKANAFAGCTRFYDIQLAYETVQLGYTWYGKNFGGTGLNKHCKYLLLSFAFEEMNMVRVEFRADNNNERSIAAMKSIGCKVEGILRSNMPTRFKGIRRDSIVLSILRDEWFGGVKERLGKKLASSQPFSTDGEGLENVAV